MKTKQAKHRAQATRPVVTIAKLKLIRGLSRSEQKKTVGCVRRALRQQGIYTVHWSGLWLAVSDRPRTSKEIDKEIVRLAIKTCRICDIKLQGAYSFADFLALETSPRAGTTHLTSNTLANAFMQMMGMRMASTVLRHGSSSWPSWQDLQSALPTLPYPWRPSSGLHVQFGGQHD